MNATIQKRPASQQAELTADQRSSRFSNFLAQGAPQKVQEKRLTHKRAAVLVAQGFAVSTLLRLRNAVQERQGKLVQACHGLAGKLKLANRTA